MIPTISRTFAVDLAERAAWTFVQAFVGTASAVIVGSNTQNVVHLSFWQQLGAAGFGAGVGAVTSLVKGVGAGLITGTASTSKTVAAAPPAGAHAADSPATTGADSELASVLVSSGQVPAFDDSDPAPPA